MEIKTHARFGVATKMSRSVNEIGIFAHGHWAALPVSSRELPPASSLFFQGNPPQEAFYIDRGLIKLTHLDQNGQEMVVGLRTKGSLLGAASVIVQEPSPVTAITVTNCSLICIPADLFLRLAKTDEHFCWYLHQIHSHEIHQQANQLVALRYLSARQRVEALLLQLLSSIPPHEKQLSMKIRMPLRHWEIAQLIGITPEHLSRILRQIKQEGIMHKEDGHMIISDASKLRSQGD